MYPQTHFLIGIFFFLIFLFVLGIFPATIILLASVLIDIDHYTSYIFQNKKGFSFSIKNAYKWHATRQWEKEKVHPLTFFHFFEVLILILLIGLKFPVFFYIFLGFLIHLPFDIIKESRKKMLRPEKYSFIAWLIKA